MTRRCSHCHNEIPAWANGVCYVCARGERDAKRSGTKYKPASMKYSTIKRDVKSNRQTIAPILYHPLEKKTKKKKYKKSSIRIKTIQKKRPITRKSISSTGNNEYRIKHVIHITLPESTRRQILNFNKFFKETYGIERYFSHVLRKYWIQDDQIKSILSDQRALKTLLRHVMVSLRDVIENEFSLEGYSIFKLLYGLEGSITYTPEEVAKRLNIRLQSVIFMKKAIMNNLKSRIGTKKLEEIILEAYNKTQTSNN